MNCCDNKNKNDVEKCKHDHEETHDCCKDKQMEHEIHHDHNTNGEGDYYTCTMHPEIHENKPGKCPKCGGMQLVLKSSK